MSNLYLPWGSGERYKNRLSVRNQFASSLELHNQASYEYQEPLRRQRSPSLPPIYNIEHERSIGENTQRNKESYNRNISSVKRFSFYDEDAEGDTSGYGSETVNHMNIKNQCTKFYSNPNNQNSDVVVAWHEGKDVRKPPSNVRSNVDGALSARSPSGPEEGRPRWGDRGVATGRLWEPTAPTERLPQMQNHSKGTPSWVERGLNNIIDSTSDTLVFDQRRSSNSGLECDRSSYNGSDEGRTFLRGQNAPIDSEIKAQRENKRIKALELQSAILNQLEEQEKRREDERLRKLKEERLEELRIQRQQEEDRIRLEDEKRKNFEKQSLEQRKLDTLKRALEEAEKKAKQEKEKRFNCLRRTNDTNLTSETMPQTTENNVETLLSSPNKTLSPTKSNRTYNVPTTATSQNKENKSRQTTAFNSPRSIAPNNLNLYIHNVQPLAIADNQFNVLPIGITGNGEIGSSQTTNNIQLAILVPQNLKQNGCCDVSLNSYDINESSNIDRLLTPRKYRNTRIKDASTQTDMYLCPSSCNTLENEDLDRIIYKDYTHIDENAPNESPIKRDRRLKSEERYKKEIENRPKWGANKPNAQYKKQSEKDPFYIQKRKVRQKYRPQIRQYVSESSEDSRSPSPPLRHEKFSENNNKGRNSISQFFWRNKRHSQETLQINPNKSLGNTITDISSLSQTNEKKSPKNSLAKRLTLSQKFINDKYGSRKLWTEETNEKKYTSDIYKKFEKGYNVNTKENCELSADQNRL